MLSIEEHPLMQLDWFVTALPAAVGDLPTPGWLRDLLRADAASPLAPPEDALRRAVRDLLRHGGFRPTGRSKPASEYLARAAAEGRLGPINPLVDAANAVSLHSGLPVSVVDADRLEPPLRVAVAAAGERYAFNASAQEIEVGGLLCLHDQRGPCANAVKDAQRTKTSASTRRALSLVWGVRAAPERCAAAGRWYRELSASLGGVLESPDHTGCAS